MERSGGPWKARIGLVLGPLGLIVLLAATAAALLPVAGAVALSSGIDPMFLLLPAALAASCAFMLPVATPPNAVVYGSGHVPIGAMVRAGVLLNLIFVALIVVMVYTLGRLVFL